MKRKLMTYLLALMMLFTISSCEVYSYATTQDDIYIENEVDVVRSNISFDVIIQYGIPYYRDGALLYYLYRDIYYYPFYYNNYWYVRAYRRPFTHFDHRPYFRPHRYDYRFSPGHYRGFDRPRNPNVHQRIIPPRNHRNYTRPRGSRPDVQPRSSRPDTRPDINRGGNNRRIDSHQGNHQRNGNFGGRR